MHLSESDRRIHTAYEAARELAEIGAAGTECAACESEVGGEPIVLMGLVYCTDCGFAEALRLRSDESEWSALSRPDQVEALETIEQQARSEREHLARRAS